jgi:hypothetical protein
MLLRPGIWIWMIGAMVLAGAAITGVLVLAPQGQDVRLHIFVAVAVASLIAIPFSRSISKAMTAPST